MKDYKQAYYNNQDYSEQITMKRNLKLLKNRYLHLRPRLNTLSTKKVHSSTSTYAITMGQLKIIIGALVKFGHSVGMFVIPAEAGI